MLTSMMQRQSGVKATKAHSQHELRVACKGVSRPLDAFAFGRLRVSRLPPRRAK
jgi:hypothetical protein